MKVLITGVSGRVGANLAVQLKQRGYQVRGLVMPGDPKADKVRKLDIEVIEAPIYDADGVYRAVDGVDLVAHLAAQMRQGSSTPQRMFEINTLGTMNILEGALRSSRPIKRILFASTDQAYSPFVAERTTFYEDHVQKPIDIYALTKVMSEQACAEYRREYGLPIAVVRYSSVVAADEAFEVLTPAWLHTFMGLWTHNGRVPWFGADKAAEAWQVAEEALKAPTAVCGITDPNGVSWGLPFTDVRDTVQGTLLALESPDALGDTFNMVGPVPTAFVPAAKLIAQHTDRPYLEVRMPFLWFFNVANHKARSILGYDPQYDFPAMIDSALAFRRGDDIGVVPV
jgi:nucleoside-diphosphate-sugar epimerase